jgi:hypothetical protein
VDIILSTKSNTLNEYNFNIQWYIEDTSDDGGVTYHTTSPYVLALIKARQAATKVPVNTTTTLPGATTTTTIPTADDIEVDNLKRYDEVNNVTVTPNNNSTVIKEEEKMQDVSFTVVFFIILGVLLFVSALVYLFYILIFKEKEPKTVMNERIQKKEDKPKYVMPTEKQGSLSEDEIKKLMERYSKEK